MCGFLLHVKRWDPKFKEFLLFSLHLSPSKVILGQQRATQRVYRSSSYIYLLILLSYKVKSLQATSSYTIFIKYGGGIVRHDINIGLHMALVEQEFIKG